MDLLRIVRHLATTRRALHRAFAPAALASIEDQIRTAEARHGGEIRFVVEAALDGAPLFQGQSSRERAIELFSHLRVWDTEHNNGLMIYVLLADHAVEIVADRGIQATLGNDTWRDICQRMEAAFGSGDFRGGAIDGLNAVSRHMERLYPAADGTGNELPDAPFVL